MKIDRELIKMEWKYVKTLRNENAVKEFLLKQNINLSEDAILCLETNNGGRPLLNRFDTNKNKECVFKALLSYNQDDKENIYHSYSEELKNQSLFPLATDPAGNFICADLANGEQLVLWKTESGTREEVATSLTNLISSLY
jgi:hypothetical protein